MFLKTWYITIQEKESFNKHFNLSTKTQRNKHTMCTFTYSTKCPKACLISCATYSCKNTALLVACTVVVSNKGTGIESCSTK